MKRENLHPAELRAAGYQALANALGAVGMARFLQQVEHGSGNYTRDRRQWLSDSSVRTVAARIRARKKTARVSS
jgi:hypothetical protein